MLSSFEESQATLARMSDLILECRSVRKRYAHSEVLRGVSLSLHRGECLALTGPSGCGKTTLLNCLGGVDRADSGEILLQGEPITSLSNDGLATLRREKIGTIFQFFHLLPTLNVSENVEFPLQLLGVPKSERMERVTSLLKRVGLEHRTGAHPSQLSGGEMQRVAIARALVHHPPLLLADEPTGNLDSTNGSNILALLKDLTRESHCALLMVTHSAEATRVCDRTIRMRDGLIEEASA
ncbi:MAG: hypothetical protein RLZZ244_2097 [Verrucomicrobiota bacterium]